MLVIGWCPIVFLQVEKWLLELEKAMKASVHYQCGESYDDYTQRPREDWVLVWPGQAVLYLQKIPITKINWHIIDRKSDLLNNDVDRSSV